MARVFLPPHYKGQDQRYVKLLSEDFADHATLASLGMDIASGLHDVIGFEDEREAFSVGVGRPLLYANTLRDALRGTVGCAKTVLTDYKAVITLWELIIGGSISLNASRETLNSVSLARDLALMGCVGGSVTPALALRWLEDRNPLDALRNSRLITAGTIQLPDILREGVRRGKALRHFRECVKFGRPIEVNELEVTDSAFSSALDCSKAYVLPVGILFQTRGMWFLLSNTTLGYLADTVWTVCNWLMSAHLDPKEGSYSAALDGVKYCLRAVRANAGRVSNLERIGRHMKCAYSCVIATLGHDSFSEGERALYESQIGALEQEARRESVGIASWSETVTEWEADLQVNYGTAWNLLPPPDADISTLNAAVKAKYNAPRDIDYDAWDDFIGYACSAISATYLVNNRDAEVKWDKEGEEPDWVAECREGRLTYPSADERRRIVRCFPWRKTLETWHLAAEDVTHVASDLERMTEVSCDVTSELEYVLEHGSRFSDGSTPARVREHWEAGSIPGDRVLYGAAKSENTKYGEKTRETMSADDITRACLSEIDENMAVIGSFVHGVTSRAGRPSIESKIASVLEKSHGANKAVLVSLDISGWSPNMIRSMEMKFIDELMKFFDIPDEQTCSCVFRSTHVVMSRLGFFDKWLATDGSIQGFFGTADTIMHSLMSQWALRQLKTQGKVARRSRMEKVTLIDDIAMAIDDVLCTEGELVAALKALYKSLGFDADVVKTLASSTKATFLNRIYVAGRESVTYAKIAAKADREWERRWVSFHDEIDSIFGSMSGAVDRGMHSLAGYFLCCYRIAQRAVRLDKSLLVHSPEVVVFGAWLPRSLGGWGMPNITAWVSRESQHALDAGLSTLSVIRQQLSRIRNAYADLIRAKVNGLASVEVRTRSIIAFVSDPLSPSTNHAIDPKSKLVTICRAALGRACKSAELKAMLQSSSAEGYQEAVSSAVAVHDYPAEAIMEWADSLPHAVCASLVTKFVDSGLLSRHLRPSHLAQAKSEFARNNRKCIGAYRGVPEGEMAGALLEGLELAVALRIKTCDAIGVRVTGLSKPTILGLVGVSDEPDDSFMEVYVPAVRVNDRTAITPEMMIIRSRSSPPAIAAHIRAPRESSVLVKAFMKCATVTACLRSSGYLVEGLRDVWTRTWAGNGARLEFPETNVVTKNFARIASRTVSRTFCAACAPNIAPAIAVRINRLLHLVSDIHCSIPHMAWVVGLRSMCAIDAELGFASGAKNVRQFTLSASACLVRDDDPLLKAKYVPSGNLRGVVSQATVARVIPLVEWDKFDDADPTVADSAAEAITIAPTRDLSPLELLKVGAAGTVFGSVLRGMGQLEGKVTSSADVPPDVRRRIVKDKESAAFIKICEGCPDDYGSEEFSDYVKMVADRSQTAYPEQIRENVQIWDMLLSRKPDRFMVAINSIRASAYSTDSAASIRRIRLTSQSRHKRLADMPGLDVVSNAYHRAMECIMFLLALRSNGQASSELAAIESGLEAAFAHITGRRTNRYSAGAPSRILEVWQKGKAMEGWHNFIDELVPRDWKQCVDVRKGFFSAAKTCTRYVWADTAAVELARTTVAPAASSELSSASFASLRRAARRPLPETASDDLSSTVWARNAVAHDKFAAFRQEFPSAAEAINAVLEGGRYDDTIAIAKGLWETFRKADVCAADV